MWAAERNLLMTGCDGGGPVVDAPCVHVLMLRIVECLYMNTIQHIHTLRINIVWYYVGWLDSRVPWLGVAYHDTRRAHGSWHWSRCGCCPLESWGDLVLHGVYTALWGVGSKILDWLRRE